MNNLFIEYPKCSTCKKAKKWLENNNIQFDDRNIVEETPTKKELKESQLKFFVLMDDYYKEDGNLTNYWN